MMPSCPLSTCLALSSALVFAAGAADAQISTPVTPASVSQQDRVRGHEAVRAQASTREAPSSAWKVAAAAPSGSADQAPPPPLAREFRAAWVASVANIDWPSRPGLSAWEQQVELLQILNRAVELHLNAVVLQIRPAADALYRSKYEPWSTYLTGQMGQAPEPLYDPLAFAVKEAHKRGLELHAWFNPFRAHHPADSSAFSTNHVSQTDAHMVRQYGDYLWLDPGSKSARQRSLDVVMDIVWRYDIDGIHLDDYFYPYKERDSTGRLIAFPDDPSWRLYRGNGGKLGRDDWRRHNIDLFIEDLYGHVKAAKPWVQVGISPFGIWRPGNPEQIQGFDAYTELYADSRKWLNEGWLDYISPQLYWRVSPPAQSYPVLLKWWVSQNTHGRHIWPGNYTSRVSAKGAGGGANRWPASELLEQVRLTRAQPGATGNVHFSMKALMDNRGGIVDALEKGPYATPALVPASPWLSDSVPPEPRASVSVDSTTGNLQLRFAPTTVHRVWLWAVRARTGGKWVTTILPSEQRILTLSRAGETAPDLVVINEVDRYGNTSEDVTIVPATLVMRPE
ncbi:MAG TPA: family 10 glycosylhydrolase [Gemmatimonadaceae bacterium]